MEIAIVGALLSVLVFTLGQIVQRFILEPMQEQRRVIGEIAFNLVYLDNIVGSITPDDERTAAKVTWRKLASQLMASLKTIPFYERLASRGWVPKRDDVLKAVSNLIGLSNEAVMGLENYPKPDQPAIIRAALRIPGYKEPTPPIQAVKAVVEAQPRESPVQSAFSPDDTPDAHDIEEDEARRQLNATITSRQMKQ